MKHLTITLLTLLMSIATFHLTSKDKYDFELFCMIQNPYLLDSYIYFNESDNFAFIMTAEKFESGIWEKYVKIDQSDRWILENPEGDARRRWIILKDETKKKLFQITNYFLSFGQTPVERIDQLSSCTEDDFSKLMLKEEKRNMMKDRK